VTNAK
jgi:small subunit ribosomal protein S13